MKAINEYLIQVSSSKTSHVCTDNDNNRFQATWEDGATGHVARCWEDPAYSTSCCMSGQIYSVEHPAYSTSCCMNFYCLSELHESCCLCELHESCCLCELHESVLPVWVAWALLPGVSCMSPGKPSDPKMTGRYIPSLALTTQHLPALFITETFRSNHLWLYFCTSEIRLFCPYL